MQFDAYASTYESALNQGLSLSGESREHFAEDVIAGAGIGIVGSLIFTRPYHGVEVVPVASEGTYGVALRTEW